MNAEPAPHAPSIPEIFAVLKKKFWTLGIVLLAANALFAFAGKEILENHLNEYADAKLRVWEDQAKTAEAKAVSAHTAAGQANEASTEAKLTAATTVKAIRALREEADGLEKRLDNFTTQLATLSDLQLKIDEAKKTLGGYKDVIERLETMKAQSN
ncbi:MAG: hypothetical protein NTY19_03135 [Planctomycetota bacterium]|nr:hypothetical protein [Planctomycetota bacterium]